MCRIRSGHVHGATDDFGHKAIESPMNHIDFHKTLMHLFGLDADALTYRTAGRDLNLTDNHNGHVIRELIG